MADPCVWCLLDGVVRGFQGDVNRVSYLADSTPHLLRRSSIESHLKMSTRTSMGQGFSSIMIPPEGIYL